MKKLMSAITIGAVLIIITEMLLCLCFGTTVTTDRPILPGVGSGLSGVLLETISFVAEGTIEDVNEPLPSFTGYVLRIVIDSNGTDTEFSVILRDTHGVAIFSKTDLTSANDPQAFVISESDTATNYYAGVPVTGPMTLEVANADELDKLAVTIYSLRIYQF